MSEIRKFTDGSYQAENLDHSEDTKESWWQRFAAAFQEQASAPTKAFLLAMAVELFGATEAGAQTKPAGDNTSSVTVEAYVDSQAMYEAWLRFKTKNGWLVASQTHAEGNTKVDFTALFAGKEITIGNSAKIIGMVGPQFDFKQ